jgi:hypothetical protein
MISATKKRFCKWFCEYEKYLPKNKEFKKHDDCIIKKIPRKILLLLPLFLSEKRKAAKTRRYETAIMLNISQNLKAIILCFWSFLFAKQLVIVIIKD